MKKGYEGKISNHGAQEVKAVFPQNGGKQGKTKTGGDLRAKPSKKK